MRRFLWVLAWFAIAVWSLFAWGAYGLLDFFGGIAARNADIVTGHAETVEWLSWILTTLRSLGLGTIVVVWGVVSLLILAVPAVLGLLLGNAQRDQRAYEWREPRAGPGPSVPFPPSTEAYPPRRIEKR